MRIAIMGGQLQGVEAAYLARMARYEVVLLDKNPTPLALKLASEFHRVDVVREPERTRKILSTVAVLLPATENAEALQALAEYCTRAGIPYLHDAHAYSISSSKVKSNLLFARIGIPTPRAWPNCQFPVIMKPSGQSGSKGVKLAHNNHELRRFQKELMLLGDEIVTEEFVSGPSLSVEVIAHEGEGICLPVTQLLFDRAYDCKRVVVPAQMTPEVAQSLTESALKIARKLGLTGIMDVEVMVGEGIPKVIEIDARLPSQTPIAVYHASGINMVEKLVRLFCQGSLPECPATANLAVNLEHFKIAGDHLEVVGETCLAGRLPLNLFTGLGGADQVLTDYVPGSRDWVATVIITGSSPANVEEKRDKFLNQLIRDHKLRYFSDPKPPVEEMVG